MATITPIDISNLTTTEDLIRFISPFCSQVGSALRKNLSFADNLKVSIVDVTFTTANQNLPIQHGLPVIPTGYIPVKLSASGTIYNGDGTVLDATFANLKCSSALTATILFF